MPRRLDWETERTDRGNRVSWLVIDELGSEPAPREALDPDPFPHFVPAGRVVAERDGNTVSVRAFNVRRLRLLISPEVVDLARPITVRVDGGPVFSAVVKPSVATLLA